MILEIAYYCKNHDILLALFSGANTLIGWVDKGSVDGGMNNSITRTKNIDNFVAENILF